MAAEEIGDPLIVPVNAPIWPLDAHNITGVMFQARCRYLLEANPNLPKELPGSFDRSERSLKNTLLQLHNMFFINCLCI